MNQDDRFEMLYRRYYTHVVRYLVDDQGVTRGAAHDVAQDVFLRVYALADEYSHDQEWEFIKTIASRVAMNRVRDERVRGNLSIEREPVPSDRVTNTPDEPAQQETAFASGEVLTRLYAAINKLSNAHRSTLLLWLSEFTFAEIARTLQISEVTVKSRLHAGRQQLRKLLTEQTFSPQLLASADQPELVPAYAQQKLTQSSTLDSTLPLHEAASQLVERVEALAAQQQHLSRQIDEYEEMLRRHLAIVSVAAAAQIKGNRSAL
ncbi:MAG TPA: RNA polymerase sigma factor [Thermoanaerobaculia bacterium]|nr:RNA polymerase sigma factor [Thermoanaerobaculia bacterium]